MLFDIFLKRSHFSTPFTGTKLKTTFYIKINSANATYCSIDHSVGLYPQIRKLEPHCEEVNEHQGFLFRDHLRNSHDLKVL